MEIRISTLVEQPVHQVWAQFDLQLFKVLAPPFPPVKVARFDGCHTGDQVHLALNFLLFRQEWHSLITDHAKTEQEYFFIDEGIRLPFFLSQWKHKHRMINENGQTLIVDEISYKTPFWLTDYLMFPALYLQFLYRKPIYQRYFRKKQ